MLSYRLLRNNYVVDKLISFSKSTNSGKIEPNVIKSNNLINKSLFGNLLETQQQRRKRLGLTRPKTSKCRKASEQDSTSLPSENTRKTDKNSTYKTSKNKNVLSESVSLEVLFPEQGACSEHSSVSALPEPTPKSSKSKNSKKLKPVLEIKNEPSKVELPRQLKKNIKPNKDLLTPLEDQFIFKSDEEMNDSNYPLENPEKINLQKKPFCVENVLSYGFSDPLVKGYAKYPSVSKIMEETMTARSKLILKRWRQNMISDLGEDGFAKYSQELKARGHDFHEAVRKTLMGETVESCSDVTQNALKSLEWMLRLTSSPLAVESIIAHPKLEYKGIPDCVAMFRKVPVLIDWKLSDKPKKDLKDTYEAPLQITAYIGALNHDPNYKWGVNHGLVAVAYTSGDPCDVFLLAPKHCEIYWRYWLQRFDKFKARSHLHIDHEIDESILKSS